MAVEIEHEHIPGLTVEGAYVMPGDITINFFDEAMQVHFRVYLNELARGIDTGNGVREQQPQPGELAELAAAKEKDAGDGVIKAIQERWAVYRRPLNKPTEFVMKVSHDDFNGALKSSLDALRAAIYALAKERSEPFGLANRLKGGKDV